MNACRQCGVRHGAGHVVTLPDLASLGISYRQLDYWTRRGLIRCDDERTPGSGVRRTWEPAELRVAERIGRLARAGVALDLAAHIARHPGESAEPVPGVYISVSDRAPYPTSVTA